ncbi:MAG: P-II family nitrogen regulator [Bacteroidetes bacterium]|nr:P-II family nitrogen regulator [Bacteroidota bacterium]
MKEIKAYVRKERADIIIEKLENAGVKGMTVLDANALAEWADKKAFSFSIEYVQKYSTVVKLEIVCEDSETDKLIDVIAKYGKTGSSGDGMIFVSTIEKSVKIKNGAVNVV